MLYESQIDTETLFSSTTYKTDYFNKCVYCHNDVENDYYEYNGEFIGQPYRCNCESAKKELKAKEELYKTLKELNKDIDIKKINESIKNFLLEKINAKDKDAINYLNCFN